VLFCVLIGLLCTLFGTLLYLTEGGEFFEPSSTCFDSLGLEILCSELYPNGAYLRPDVLGRELQETPYKSIVHSCWCVMTTICTVGYGDLFPTTPLGKLVACASMVIGLVVMALPVTVISGAFDRCAFPLTCNPRETWQRFPGKFNAKRRTLIHAHNCKRQNTSNSLLSSSSVLLRSGASTSFVDADLHRLCRGVIRGAKSRERLR
jgi:hypothetical protein